jgi:hypothetical protein
MASGSFTTADFRVFEIDGFKARMEAIRTRIRPKLESLGRGLAPDVAHATGSEAFAHVARHARRTVNPPDDTWVALGPDRRGDKKHGPFKVAASGSCSRSVPSTQTRMTGPSRGARARPDSGRCSGAWAGSRGSRTSTMRSPPRGSPT